MEMLVWLMSGGFLKGYRTQILGVTAFVSALGLWAIGDMTMVELVQKVPVMLGGLGIAALGAKANTVAANLNVSVKE